MADIVVKGAREHNLQNVDLVLPRNKLICFTGVSGSPCFPHLSFQTIIVTVHGFFKTPTFCLPNFRKPPIFKRGFENLANK